MTVCFVERRCLRGAEVTVRRLAGAPPDINNSSFDAGDAAFWGALAPTSTVAVTGGASVAFRRPGNGAKLVPTRNAAPQTTGNVASAGLVMIGELL